MSFKNSFQQLTVCGYLGADPELRFTNRGDSVAKFSLAVSEVWKNNDGTTSERTVWFTINAWGAQAEPCAQYLKKGYRVLVTGTLQMPNVFTDREGISRAALDVRASNVVFLTSKSEAEARRSNNDNVYVPSNKGEALQNEDVPF
jgi:single-strand DNA-binding protein